MSCAAAWSAPSSALGRHPGRRGGRRPCSSSSSVQPRAAAAAAAGQQPEGDGGAGEAPRLVLHDSLDAAGVATAHARSAREGFAAQVGRLTRVSAGTSIAISRGADLARAALCVAAEDDSLVSHSSVPLPVDAFITRLDYLSTGFCAGGNFPPARAPPEVFFDYLERYLYIHKVHSWGVKLFWPSCYPNWGQGKTFRSESTGKPENFPFPVHPRKGFPIIFRYFSFQNLKIQKYL